MLKKEILELIKNRRDRAWKSLERGENIHGRDSEEYRKRRSAWCALDLLMREANMSTKEHKVYLEKIAKAVKGERVKW